MRLTQQTATLLQQKVKHYFVDDVNHDVAIIFPENYVGEIIIRVSDNNAEILLEYSTCNGFSKSVDASAADIAKMIQNDLSAKKCAAKNSKKSNITTSQLLNLAAGLGLSF
jgi:hypothetical protein